MQLLLLLLHLQEYWPVFLLPIHLSALLSTLPSWYVRSKKIFIYLLCNLFLWWLTGHLSTLEDFAGLLPQTMNLNLSLHFIFFQFLIKYYCTHVTIKRFVSYSNVVEIKKLVIPVSRTTWYNYRLTIHGYWHIIFPFSRSLDACRFVFERDILTVSIAMGSFWSRRWISVLHKYNYSSY